MGTAQLQLFKNDLSGVIKGALISECGQYRYKLWRRWSKDGPQVLFIGLNPSTADGDVEDNTTRRFLHFARYWGFGSYCLVNLFAYRSTDPSNLKSTEDPIGPDNDKTIMDEIPLSNWIVPCWGVHGTLMERNKEVIELLDEWKNEIGAELMERDFIPPTIKCFGFTKNQQPKHPLYLRNETELIDFPLRKKE